MMTVLALSGSLSSQRRDPLEYIQILESADRVKKLQVDRVIEALNVKAGEAVADLGAGSGLFTRPLARQVAPGGIVYAIDINQALLDHIEETARELKLDNIRTVLAGESDPRIPAPVDLVLIVDTLHHIQNRGNYLKILPRYLKPSGRVAVIDFAKNWPPRFASGKFSVQQLERWMKAAGFQRERSYDFLEESFFHIYRLTPKNETK